MEDWHFLTIIYETLTIPYILYQKINNTRIIVREGKSTLENISLGESVRNYKEKINELKNNRLAFFLTGGRRALYDAYQENRIQRKVRNLSPSNHLSQAE